MLIVNLLEAPDKAPELARWYVAEWEPWYGPDGAGDAAADIAAYSGRDALPVCLIALDADGEMLGSAALKTDSVGSEGGEGPWLAAVLVAKDQRGRGIGTALVGAVEDEATRLGFESLYTSTDTAARILERRQWRRVGTAESLRGQIAVYLRDLKDA